MKVAKARPHWELSCPCWALLSLWFLLTATHLVLLFLSTCESIDSSVPTHGWNVCKGKLKESHFTYLPKMALFSSVEK